MDEKQTREESVQHKGVNDQDNGDVGEKIRRDFYCKVSEVFSPESFFVQVQGKEQDLDNLLSEINDFYNDVQLLDQLRLPSYQCQVDSLVATIWEDDGFWYRAKIISIESPSKVQVLFIDFGTKALVFKEKLYFLHELFSISERPALAFHAKLAGIGPVARKWGIACSNRFQSLTGGGLIGTENIFLRGTIVEGNEKQNKVLLNLFTHTNGNEENVADVLVKEGFARFVVNERAAKSFPKNFEKVPGILQQLNTIVKVPEKLKPSQQTYIDKIREEFQDLEKEHTILQPEDVSDFARKQMKLVKKVVGMSMDFLMTHPDTKNMMTPRPEDPGKDEDKLNDSPHEKILGGKTLRRPMSIKKFATSSSKSLKASGNNLKEFPETSPDLCVASYKQSSKDKQTSILTSIDNAPANNIKSLRNPSTGTDYEEPHDSRVFFSIQEGCRSQLNEVHVKRAFSQFGPVFIVKIFKRPVAGLDGYVGFNVESKSSVVDATNKRIQVGDLKLLTLTYWKVEQVSEHQIAVLSRDFEVFDRSLLKSFFEEHGSVTGIIFPNGFSRRSDFVVSFEDPKVVQRLVGSTIEILNTKVLVEKVCQETVFRSQYLKAKSSSRIWFNVQFGSKSSLRKSQLAEAFSQFGPVKEVVIFLYDVTKRGIDGFIEFDKLGSRISDAVNQVVNIGNGCCQLYCFRHWALLNDNPVPHQILVTISGEYSLFNRGSLRSYFSKIEPVTGVIYLGNIQIASKLFKHCYIIGLQGEEAVTKLVGSYVDIMGSSGYVKEVTKKTFCNSILTNPYHIM